jgi:hypothetical protein
MAARGMVFGAFNVDLPTSRQRHWRARLEERHIPNVEIKGATLRELAVAEDRPGEWRAQCTVEFARL